MNWKQFWVGFFLRLPVATKLKVPANFQVSSLIYSVGLEAEGVHKSRRWDCLMSTSCRKSKCAHLHSRIQGTGETGMVHKGKEKGGGNGQRPNSETRGRHGQALGR